MFNDFISLSALSTVFVALSISSFDTPDFSALSFISFLKSKGLVGDSTLSTISFILLPISAFPSTDLIAFASPCDVFFAISSVILLNSVLSNALPVMLFTLFSVFNVIFSVIFCNTPSKPVATAATTVAMASVALSTNSPMSPAKSLILPTKSVTPGKD